MLESKITYSTAYGLSRIRNTSALCSGTVAGVDYEKYTHLMIFADQIISEPEMPANDGGAGIFVRLTQRELAHNST